jgi:hypothetical protein
MPVGRPGSDRQHIAARRFSHPSPLFRWADEANLMGEVGHALVFGAGLLVEAKALADRGWTVDAVETRDRLARAPELYSSFETGSRTRVLTGLKETRRRYRLILVTHVLEFIEDPKERLRVLVDLGNRLTQNGVLLLSLRGWSDVRAAKGQIKRGDGLVTGLGTWVRGFTTAEALSLVAHAGLEGVDGPQTKRSTRPRQVRFVCRKTWKSGRR